MIYLAWIAAILAGAAWMGFLLLRSNARDNEFADGAEIDEDEIVGGVDGDLRSFVPTLNGKI